jgi:hypothetical protein
LKGAIVFLIVFVLGLYVTLENPTLPPGQQIYDMLNVPDTNYPVLGISLTTLAISILNGVVYGFVVWLVCSIIWAVTGRGKKEKANVNVNVYSKPAESRVVNNMPHVVNNTPHCTNCGIPVDVTQKFCPNCGQRLGPVPMPPQQPVQPVATQTAPTASQQVYTPMPPSTPVAPSTAYGERIISIVPNLKKPKSFGRWDTYNLIVTERRCIFALLTADMLNKSIQEANEQGKAQGKGFMDRWGDQMSATMSYWRRYESMDPEAALRENPANFSFDRSSVKKAYVEHRRRGNQRNAPPYCEVIIETRGGNYKYESDADPGPEVSRAFG